MLDFKQSYFDLFGLPEDYNIDTSALALSFRELQAKYHPDRFVNSDEQERRVAVQTTGFINEANETLKSSRLRARYMLQQKGVDFDDEIDTTSDGMFLMHQMEMREALEDVPNAKDPIAGVDDIAHDVESQMDALKESFVEYYAAEKYAEAKEDVLKMKFFERLCQEVKTLTEKLEDEMF
jgi:molecular chaperone HscB